jgi:hypothetical protein
MKLYKGYHPDGHDHEKVVVGFFESAQEAENRLVEIELEDYRGYVDDMELGAIREDYPGLIESITNINELYETICRIDVEKQWKIEEIEYSGYEGLDVYSCISKEIHFDEDILVFEARDDTEAKDIEAYYLDQSNPHMREFIGDCAINMSSAEFFYHDDKGYMFELGGSVKIRQDILDRFDGDRKSTWKYIDEWFERNVKEFFRNDPGLGELYLKKAFEDKDLEFPERMYLYFWRYSLLDDYVINQIKQPVKEAVLV